MKLTELLAKVTGLSDKLAANEKALGTANEKIASLSEEIKNLSAKAADSDDESDKLAETLEQLRQILNDQAEKSAEDDSDEDSSDDDSDSSDDSEDDSDDENDSEEKAKSTSKVETAKALVKLAKQVVGAKKKAEASVDKKVISKIASIGMPAPVATQTDGAKTALKGLDRVSAAFTEQLNNE